MKKTTSGIGAIFLAIAMVSRDTSSRMEAGKYPAEIFSAEETLAGQSTEWKDQTPQLKIVFRTDKGKKMTHWYNLHGFVRYANLTEKEKQSGKFEARGEDGYAVDIKSGKRVVAKPSKDPVNAPSETDKCMNILSTLGCNAGIPKGAGFNESDLISKKVGIVVGINKQDNARVDATYMLAETKELVAAEVEA